MYGERPVLLLDLLFPLLDLRKSNMSVEAYAREGAQAITPTSTNCAFIVSFSFTCAALSSSKAATSIGASSCDCSSNCAFLFLKPWISPYKPLPLFYSVAKTRQPDSSEDL